MKALRLLCFLLLSPLALLAQTPNQQQTLASRMARYQQAFPKEKLYLSFDKPYYNAGDTIWFKSVLLNGDYTRNERTDKIYVELFNDSLALIENRVIALNNGLGYGDFSLRKTLPDGAYTIRAYSNWQQNFGTDYFFQESFYVGNAGQQAWMIDSYQKLGTATNGRTLDLKLKLSNQKKESIGYREVEIYLMNDNKRVLRATLQTTQDGILETKIPLADNKINGRYNFYIFDKKNGRKMATLPVLLQEPDELDLQFMPEGGYLVNNIYGKVAFKALGNTGLGFNLKGKIVNGKNEQVAEINALHKGMGNFYLLPQKGDSYFAVYSLNGKEQRQALPMAKEEGTTLRIDALSKPDSLLVYIKASETMRVDQSYELLAQQDEETLLAMNISLKNGFSNLKLAKKDFPNGIIHFTLFSPEQAPLNERQAIINHNEKIKLEISPSQSSYGTRDSIALALKATTTDGSPLSGSFAIAVTDKGMVKQNENESNIASYFLLQSNIKGNIEEPGWYFKNNEAGTLEALDNLLLTQAWVGYKWPEMLAPQALPKFKAEKGNIIEGKLTGLFNKPAANVRLNLLSVGKNLFFTDTVSNSQGRFAFTDIPLIDTPAYTIKIKNAKGKTSSATITVDEFKPAAAIAGAELVKPWYVNADSTLANYYQTAEKQIKQQEKALMATKGTLLKEVEIKGNKKLKDFIETQAWDAKFMKTISEEDLKKVPQKTLLDLLKETLPGFRVGTDWTPSCAGRLTHYSYPNYVIGSSLISHVVVDKINSTIAASGIPDAFNQTGISNTNTDRDVFAQNTLIFNALSAADIKEINVYRGCVNYYLEITTRSGRGPWIDISRGVYVYRPLPLYVPKEFYSPKYTVNSSATPDMRSTIYWNANVVTDQNGKATVSFYAADLPTSYSIKIEGTDLMGRFGYEKGTIKIVNKTESK